MLQVIGTAAAALVGAHRYSNINSPRRCCCWVECILGSRYIRGYSKRVKMKKKRHTSKKGDKRSKKANTPRQQSNRWTIQLNNSKSVSDWRRSSRRPKKTNKKQTKNKKGRMVLLYRYSSTSGTSTRRCSYLDTATDTNFSNFAR